jgi:sphingolipid delta-4 desaturase
LAGPKALAYLVIGTLLGMGVHPTAYHFISEHCVFAEGFETYSYYGYLNAIMYLLPNGVFVYSVQPNTCVPVSFPTPRSLSSPSTCFSLHPPMTPPLILHSLKRYNVGYHNEHHDFPNVPGSRLYRVKELAPEFYDTLPSHTSWLKVYVDYITRPEISPYSRVKREKVGTKKA